MVRLVVSLMILCVLVANVAWAVAADDPASCPGAAPALDAVVDGGGPAQLPSDTDDAPWDHCCHGSAHYLGLPLTVFAAHRPDASAAPSAGIVTYHSRVKEPPLQPPRA